MEAKSLGYSTKNIPLGNKDVYLKEPIDKTEHFLRRFRLRVYYFLKNNIEETETENFKFRTLNKTPKNQILYNFGNNLYEMIRKIEFKPVRTEFQRKLSREYDLLNVPTKFLYFQTKLEIFMAQIIKNMINY